MSNPSRAEPRTPSVVVEAFGPRLEWTPALDACLRRLWSVEGRPASRIAITLAAALGRPVSRDAVLGRVVRLGLQRAGRLRGLSEVVQGDERCLEPTSAQETAVGVPGTHRLADLRTNQCRFACTPHDARPEDHRFCGRQTFVGPRNLHGSWCPEHLEVVRGDGSRSERSAVRDAGRVR